MDDNDFLDNIVFGDSGEEENLEDLEYDFDHLSLEPNNQGFHGSNSYDFGDGISSEERLEYEMIGDPLYSNLKYPPVVTQRTVPVLSTSAPHFHTILGQNKRSSFHMLPQLDSVCSGREKHPELYPNNESRSPLLSSASPGTLEARSPTWKAVGKASGIPYPSLERELRLIHMEENEDTDESGLNLVGYEGEDNAIVGSIPKMTFWKEIPVKQDINSRVSAVQSRFCKGKFTTISTLSFDTLLSPDTPKIVIGNPRTARKRILFTVAIHGDEPCGIIGFNELLQEGYFDSIPSDISVSRNYTNTS